MENDTAARVGRVSQKDETDSLEQAMNVVDSQLLKSLPPSTQVKGLSPHSTSFWTRTARIETTIGGEDVPYFIKLTYGERGRNMVSGEFIAMQRIHDVKPDFVPRPIAWGTYESMEDVHYLLCEFRDMETKLPAVEPFSRYMAELHRNATSPNGRFGFDCVTYHGSVPIKHGWHDSWEGYFSTTTRALLETEQVTRGRDDTISRLCAPFFDTVIVRLLRPLEMNGRWLNPSLIHGDLWHGNVAVDARTGQPIVFDAAGFYAHHEYELAVWRQPWNEIGEPYRRGYCEHSPPSEPKEDFEDRGLLYATRVNILDSILYKNDQSYRNMLIEGMQTLVSKYATGEEARSLE